MFLFKREFYFIHQHSFDYWVLGGKGTAGLIVLTNRKFFGKSIKIIQGSSPKILAMI